MMEKELDYIQKIDYYSSTETKRIIISPDIVIESEGIACGDKVKLVLVVHDGKCIFNVSSEGCRICTAISNFLVEELFEKSVDTITSFIKDILDENYNERTMWLKEIPLERQLCILTPLNLLKKAITLITPECSIDNTAQLLACDACVSSFKINWNSGEKKKKEVKSKSIFRTIKDVNSLEDTTEMKYQKLGKSVLNKSEINDLESLMFGLKTMEYKKIKKLRLPMLYRNNIEKYSKKLYFNEVTSLSKKQIISKDVTKLEVAKINEVIKNNNWKIAKVKGAKTADYYKENLERTHLDYDYVASSVEDATLFVNYLLNVEGFKFITGGSVPFSLKIVDDYNKKETLTGHLHLEKIVQDSFQIVIDINIGGFPLGRTGIVKLNDQNEVGMEEQFIITLCHIFKHELVYMKDINDIYYLLISEKLDFNKLDELIKLNNLELFYYVLMEYMAKEFDIKGINYSQFKTLKNQFIQRINKKKWPYSRSNHFWIKLSDIFNHCIKSYGLIEGSKEAYKQCVGGKSSSVYSEVYTGINKKKNVRTYLYPTVIFNRTIDFTRVKDESKFEKVVTNCIYRYEDEENSIIITNFGLFIPQENTSENKDRKQIVKVIKRILNLLEITEDSVNQEYIMQARPELWLY